MFKLMKNLNTKHYLYILASIGLIAAQVWLDLELPEIMGKITSVATTGQGTEAELWQYGGTMILYALGSAALSICTGFLIAKVAAGLSYNLRGKLYGKINSFAHQDFNKFSVPSLITRSTNDITNIQMFVAMGVQSLIKAPIFAIWVFGKISVTSWQWSLATGIAIGLLVLVILTVVLIALPKFKKIQKLTDKLNNAARENVTGIRVVRAYNAEVHQEEKFEKVSSEVQQNNLFTSRSMSVLPAMMTLVMNGLNLAIYLIGAWLINSIDATSMQGIMARSELFGEMIEFSSYAMQMVITFTMLVIVFIMLPRAVISAKRINEVLDTKNSIVSGMIKASSISGYGTVEFKNVSFKYPNASNYVLENINLKIERGQTVAFIGSTGSGKSTLINLVPRFYDATDGQVFIDGVDIKHWDKKDLNKKLGYVPQKSVLFSGTIKDNIAFGAENSQDIDNKDVMQVATVAQASNFVKTKGIDGRVAQGGSNFSGGQKQRLAIARALAVNPEIYIFDDSFSALDYKTDKVLRAELRKLTAKKGATTLIVGQRIGTIKDADVIVVLDNGKVVGQGTHIQLLESCSVYREIALSQLSEEELV